MCTVSANHEIEIDLYLSRATWFSLLVPDLEPGLTLLEIRPRQLVIEEEFDVRHVI